MSHEYRTLEPLPFCSLDKRLEKLGIVVEMGAKVTSLIGPNGVLFARPEGNSTHFECGFGVDTQAVLDAIKKEYGVTILDEDDPRFWGFSNWEDMRRKREAMEQRNILVEGPSNRDARFAVAWLSAARALYRLIEIKDEHELAHLENLFVILSESEAQGWMDRLRNMEWTERLADRDLLLRESESPIQCQ
jgi:hypothetical protein